MELDVSGVCNKSLYIDETGFWLCQNKTQRKEHHMTRAIISVPEQCSGNITLSAAGAQNGVIHHHATLGLYNTAHIITFLDTQQT